VSSSMFDILNRTKRIVVPCVAAAALIAPSAAWAMQGSPPPAPELTSESATLPDLPPANPNDVGQSEATLPDLAPADPTAVGRPVVPITVSDPVSSSFGTSGRIAEPSTLPDLAPANPTNVAVPATALPDLAPANPTQVAVVERPAPADNLAARNRSASPVVATSDDGFDFGDAGIGVAVVAGACALLLAVAAFLVGRRRRLGASHS
jgi:hypothetical protein